MKLTDHIHLIAGGGFGYTDARDCNTYLVDGGDELALIDSGGGESDRLLENLQKVVCDGKRLKYLVLTHCHFDHIGGNRPVKERFGCEIAVHESEAGDVEKLDSELVLMNMARSWGLDFPPAKVDRKLVDGDRLAVGDRTLQVIHAPGNTPGSICLKMREQGKTALFTGDTLLAQGRLGFINGPGFDLDAHKASLKKLEGLNADMIFPGHGTFVLSDAVEHVKLYSAKFHAPWINVVTAVDLMRMSAAGKK
jgi:glyoxylase-like metal-dependent hydrolase (beta-lactamase superfamily II)